MPIDPQARKILDEGIRLPALETLSVAAARKRCRDTFCTKEIPEHVSKVDNRILSFTVDHAIYNIPVRIYTPGAGPPLPVLVYFHGGGFVVNNLDTHDAICRNLANTAGCIVVSVDYARSPEYRYPVALKQCYRVTTWVAENATLLGADPFRIAVGGDSSGGILAAGVSLMGRDLKTPHIRFQLLLYPALDYYLPGTDSYEKFSAGYSLTRETMRWFFSLYLPKNFNRNDPYLFPVRAQRHDNLPATHIITAQYDPLRDEAERYAELLEKSGCVVTLKRYAGMIHGFIIMRQTIDMGKKALKEAGIVLKNHFTQK